MKFIRKVFDGNPLAFNKPCIVVIEEGDYHYLGTGTFKFHHREIVKVIKDTFINNK